MIQTKFGEGIWDIPLLELLQLLNGFGQAKHKRQLAGLKFLAEDIEDIKEDQEKVADAKLNSFINCN